MTPEEMKLVENFITKEGPEQLEFKEMQAIVRMLYDIYIYTVEKERRNKECSKIL